MVGVEHCPGKVIMSLVHKTKVAPVTENKNWSQEFQQALRRMYKEVVEPSYRTGERGLLNQYEWASQLPKLMDLVGEVEFNLAFQAAVDHVRRTLDYPDYKEMTPLDYFTEWITGFRKWDVFSGLEIIKKGPAVEKDGKRIRPLIYQAPAHFDMLFHSAINNSTDICAPIFMSLVYGKDVVRAYHLTMEEETTEG